jgi:hypothetical protein
MNQLKKLVLKFEQAGCVTEEKNHIRQYFKPKSTGNFNSNLNINLNFTKALQNSAEKRNPPNSNRSNYEVNKKIFTLFPKLF